MEGERLPLTGVRVLDFTWVVAGPLCTKYLAAHGAEVIKVESGRTRTDATRQDATVTRPGASGPNMSGSFSNNNSDKLAITLNMEHEEAREIARRLVAISDVVVDNFSPDVMSKWGLSYEELRAINPGIIAASMPGLGSTGPHRNFRGLGSFFQARSSLDELTGYPHREIADIGFAYPDTSCNPFHTALAILAALHHRNRTGQGQCIEQRQVESTINYLGPGLLDYEVNGREQTRTGSRVGYAAPHGIYRCSGDDRWCTITVFTEEEWRSFCDALGDPEWITNPLFATLLGRKANEGVLDTLIQEWTSQRPAEEVMELLQRFGVAAGMVQHVGDLVERDPQIAARGFYVEMEHPEMGLVRQEGVPFKLSETPARFQRPAPRLGENNDYVLQELLEMSEAEVNQLILQEVIM